MIYDRDQKLSTEIPSYPHPTWGKPYVKGSIKTFFMPSVRYGREIIELINRSEFEYENVTYDRVAALNEWGIGNYSSNRGGFGDFSVPINNLENAMISDKKLDVLVIANAQGWGIYTEKTRKAILERVKNGAGLIIVQPYNGFEIDKVAELEEISPLIPLYDSGNVDTEESLPYFDKVKVGPWKINQHYITRGIPFETLPYDILGYLPYKANGEVLIEAEDGTPILAVKQYGKGRVVTLGYYARDILPQHKDFPGWEECYDSVTGFWKGAFDNKPFNYLEYFYSLINRAIIWASSKEAECQIEDVTYQDNKILAKVTPSCKDDITIVIKNLYDEKLFETSQNSREVIIPEDIKIGLGGDFRADVYLKCGSKVSDWYTRSFSIPKVASIRDLSVNSLEMKIGEVIEGAVEVIGEKAKLTINLVDAYDRIIDRFVHDGVANTSVNFSFNVNTLNSVHVCVQAVLTADDFVIQKEMTEKIVVQLSDRKIKDFEIFNCPQNRGHGEFLALERDCLIETGITGLYYGDNRSAASTGCAGLGLRWHEREKFVKQKENFILTKDKKYLHRFTCFDSVEFKSKNRAVILESVKKNKKYGPFSYYSNDEGSITCYKDEMDICFCEETMVLFREWLKPQYKNLDELNANWGTSFESWENVVPMTLIESRKHGNYSSWGAHRRYMEDYFANVYKFIKDTIREIDPEGIVRLSGTQLPVASNGYNYYKLHQHVGLFECYEGGNQIELQRSFMNAGTVLGIWFGYGRGGFAEQSRAWKVLFHGFNLINIFWEFNCLNPDFSFSDCAIGLSKAFKEIRREGVGKLLLFTTKRDNLGIGIHYSKNSLRGAYINGGFNRFQSDRQGWISIIEDLGYQYNFVDSEQVEAGDLTSKGYKVLIMPNSNALSNKEIEEIEIFVKNGGMIVGDYQIGVMDENCAKKDEAGLDKVFGIKRYEVDIEVMDTEKTSELEFDPSFNAFEPLSTIPDLFYVEQGIRKDGAQAMYYDHFMHRVALFTYQKYGKGQSIYLNIPFDTYQEMRKNPAEGKHHREMVRKIFDLAGIVKFAELRDQEGAPIEAGYETIYYSDGPSMYFGLRREADGNARYGLDGVLIQEDTDGESENNKIALQLCKKSHVYDIRNKKYLGNTDKIDIEIIAGDNALISLLPDKVDRIAIKAANSVKCGDKFSVDVEILSDKKANSYANVIALNIYEPDGKFAFLYSENIIVKSKAMTKTITIPFNEKTGTWKIVAKDVASGVNCEKEFVVV